MKRHWVRLQLRFEAPKDVKLEMLSRRAALMAIHCYNCHLSRQIYIYVGQFLQPPVHSTLKITNRFFRHAAPHLLWNRLPPTLRVPYQSGASSSISSSPSSCSDPRPRPVVTFLMTFLSLVLKPFFSQFFFTL